MKKQHLSHLFLMIVLISCQSEHEHPENEIPTISIQGSDTEFMMVKELADAFAKITEYKFAVTGDGTSTGIDALIKGDADIANCSRQMYAHEISSAQENNINPTRVTIAIDAIALISNPHNRVDSLSTLDIQGVFSGAINNWSQLGGVDHPINFYGRNEKSGTYKFLEDRFVRYEGFSYKMIQMESNQDILEAVKKDTFGIGYVGAGFLMDDKGKPNSEIWAMYVYTEGENLAYSPYQTVAVMDGNYSLVRPLYQYFNGVPNGPLAEFLKYELSDEGQEIIRSMGFFPITSQYESENKRQGIAF